MITEMAGPICFKLSGIAGARWGSVLGKKKFKIEIFYFFEFFFSVLVPEPYMISACVTTLSALRTVALRHIYLIRQQVDAPRHGGKFCLGLTKITGKGKRRASFHPHIVRWMKLPCLPFAAFRRDDGHFLSYVV